MTDSRHATVGLVMRDMYRTLHRLPKVRTEPRPDHAWCVVAVSVQQWELFYPPLSFITSEEDPILIWSFWDRLPPAADLTVTVEWVMKFWCVVRPTPEGFIRMTTESTQAFGEAVTPTEDFRGERISGPEDPQV